VQTLNGSEAAKGQFETVLMGMHTLLVNGILADQTDLINAMLDASFMHYVAILIYMLVVAISMADMLIGVIGKIVEDVADAERDEMLKHNVNGLLNRLRDEDDEDEIEFVSRAEFNAMLMDDECLEQLEVELCVEGDFLRRALEDYEDVMFHGNAEISLDDFLEGLMAFRSSGGAFKQTLEMKRFVKGLLKESQLLK